MKSLRHIPRMLIAKIGLDGHNRGAQVVAYGLRDAGMEVIYMGIRQVAAGVAKTAVEEDVDVIGVSSMVGAHLAVMKRLKKELEALTRPIPGHDGGIIPEEDYHALRELGAGAIHPHIRRNLFQRVRSKPIGHAATSAPRWAVSPSPLLFRRRSSYYVFSTQL